MLLLNWLLKCGKSEMKGIILAGGSGSRLYPLTLTTNKQLLPIYDKPMIYYSLDLFLSQGIEDICLITSPQHIKDFEKISYTLKDIFSINLIVQDQPKGIAESFLLSEEFIKGNKVMLVLGDTFIHGKIPPPKNTGATIYAKKVKNPNQYGVVEFYNGKTISIEEKPESPKSHYAVPGIYFYDEMALEYAKQIKPSARGELEITDINKQYLEKDQLHTIELDNSIVWLDAGTYDSLFEASEYVRDHQSKTSNCIGLNLKKVHE